MSEQKSKEAETDMFITTISLNQDIHRKLKHLAVDQGVSVRDLIRRAIEQFLGSDKTDLSGGPGSHLEDQ